MRFYHKGDFTTTMNELQTKMAELCMAKVEKRKADAEYREKMKPLSDRIKALEDEITASVLAAGHTITGDGIKAEFKPRVVFKLKRSKVQ